MAWPRHDSYEFSGHLQVQDNYHHHGHYSHSPGPSGE